MILWFVDNIVEYQRYHNSTLRSWRMKVSHNVGWHKPCRCTSDLHLICIFICLTKVSGESHCRLQICRCLSTMFQHLYCILPLKGESRCRLTCAPSSLLWPLPTSSNIRLLIGWQRKDDSLENRTEYFQHSHCLHSVWWWQFIFSQFCIREIILSDSITTDYVVCNTYWWFLYNGHCFFSPDSIRAIVPSEISHTVISASLDVHDLLEGAMVRQVPSSL